MVDGTRRSKDLPLSEERHELPDRASLMVRAMKRRKRQKIRGGAPFAGVVAPNSRHLMTLRLPPRGSWFRQNKNRKGARTERAELFQRPRCHRLGNNQPRGLRPGLGETLIFTMFGAPPASRPEPADARVQNKGHPIFFFSTGASLDQSD